MRREQALRKDRIVVVLRADSFGLLTLQWNVGRGKNMYTTIIMA